MVCVVIIQSKKCKNGALTSHKFNDLSLASEARLKMPPHLRMNFMVYRNTPENFML